MKPSPKWSPEEIAEWDDLKKDNGVYRRGIAVMGMTGFEISLLPVEWISQDWYTLNGPIVTLSIADAEALVKELQTAIEARKKRLNK